MDLLSYLKKNPAVPPNFLNQKGFNGQMPSPTYQLPNNGGSYNATGTNPVSSPQAPMPTGNVFTPTEFSSAQGVFNAQPTAPQTSNPSSITPGSSVSTDEFTPEQYDQLNAILERKAGGKPLAMQDGAQGITSIALRNEQMRDRMNGTGLYSIPKGSFATPEQILGIRKMADEHYANLINTYADAEKTQATINKNEPKTLTDLSNSPWLEGLRINGLVQGGTADERSQNLAYLASLPEERQKALVRSGLYNSMSTGERQKFDSYDEVVAGTQQIATMLPADIETNPYKYVADKYSVFLGGKGTKPYQDFEAVLGRITAPIINNIYGAAVTGSELARAQTFIPDLAIDSTQRVGEKLKNLAAFAEFANDAALAKKAGMPKPSLDDYIKKYEGIVDGTYNKSKSGGAITWDNILD